MAKKIPLVLFSGGLDSSFLLHKLLQDGDVDVLYVKGVLHDTKMEVEQVRRDEIISIAEKQTGNKVRNRYLVNLGEMPFGGMACHSFTQPSMWLMGALMISDSAIHSSLNVGYVMGDQISALLSNITAAWHNFQAFSKANEAIPLEFPLWQTSKQKILYDIHPELVRKVWYCEKPRIRYLDKESNDPPLISPLELADELVEIGESDGDAPDEVFSLTEEIKPKRKKIIRPCGNCDACITMEAQLFIWRKRTNAPYSRYVIRKIHDLKREERYERDAIRSWIMA